jgi:hypothetical protein
MKSKIEQILKQLVGFEITKTTRSGATECLKFGTKFRNDHKGIERQIGAFALHLQCPWRFTKDNKILVGDNDLFEQTDETGEYNEDFNWDIQGGNLRDVKLMNLLKSRGLVVKSIEVDDFGGFELAFPKNIKLKVFPTLSSKSTYSEYWRLLDNRNNESKHFVVGPLGFDE